jgi:pimeloyl-ACP methyl ester carboxylesterase
MSSLDSVGKFLTGWFKDMTNTLFMTRPDGRIGYEFHPGHGPLVICIPSMGDVRAEYRFLRPRLLEAGYSVALMDIRGHGESSTSFRDYSAAAIGSDIVALITELAAERTYIFGASMGAAAAVWAATELPERVDGLLMAGPFVREMAVSAFLRTLLKVLFMRPWGPTMWSVYYKSLYPLRVPSDFAEYSASLTENLREPGRMEALQAMVDTSKASCEERIPEVKCKTLVVMGTRDPDFPDPTAEAALLTQHLPGEIFLVDGAGHYPHVEVPEIVAPRIIKFLESQESSFRR